MAEQKTSVEQTMEKKLKQVQMNLLDKLVSGGMNQNDLMAYMSMLQKQEPNTWQDMMPMVMAMKMMNPAPKTDNTAPMMLMMMLQSMKGSGDSKLERKIDKLESAMRTNEDKKNVENIMNEIRNLKNNQDGISTKDLLMLMANKDEMLTKARLEADSRSSELMVNQLKSSFDALQHEMKRMGSGGDLGKIGETVKTIKELSNTLNLNKPVSKPREEILKDIIEAGVKPLAPAIQAYVEKMGQQQPQISPQVQARLQNIQAQKVSQNAQPTQLQQPQGSNQIEGVLGKDFLAPDLINIADGGTKANRNLRFAQNDS